MKITRLSSLSSYSQVQNNLPTGANASKGDLSVLDHSDSQAATVSSSIEDPEVRAKRVNELKDKIANGTYNPDSIEVAKSVLMGLFS